MIITIPGGGGTGTGNVTGPVSSVAGDLASFADASGTLLADSGTRVAPIFSTPVLGTSMVTSGTNTVVVGPTGMSTPGANGTYRFTIQIVQTANGSGGTCAAGSVAVNLSYKDADSAVTYAVGTTLNVPIINMGGTTITASAAMANGANGVANNYVSLPREFRAASGVAIAYQVLQNVNSNCTTPPVFATRPALYYMGY